MGILISFQYVLDVSVGAAASNGLSVLGIFLVLVGCLAIYTARTSVPTTSTRAAGPRGKRTSVWGIGAWL